jgi:Transglycosylase-like domain/LysM domain
LGSHSKPSRNRFTHLLPTAAVPALAGVAAAVCLAPQALADPGPAHAAAQPAAATRTATIADALSRSGMSPVELFFAAQHAGGNTAKPASYTVRSGDSLSAIAGKVYHKQNAWPVLYWANRDKIHWANVVGEGQVLKVPALPAKIPAAPSQLGPAPAPVAAPVATSGSAPAQATASGSYSGASGSFEACVIARESGGNSQVMNSSGHYGLYQFSASTWQAYGGSAASFGHASAAEQHRVFSNAVAQGGQSNWSPYDGC